MIAACRYAAHWARRRCRAAPVSEGGRAVVHRWYRVVLLVSAAALAACGPQFIEVPGPSGEPRLEAARFIAADGVVLPLHRWEPDGEPRGIVIALHSFGDFGLAFETLGPELARSGLRVLAIDQRGFGAAPGKGRWWGGDVLVDDARALVAAAAGEAPDLPVHLIGESMGGAVALLAATGPFEVASVAAAAPAVRNGLPGRPLIDTALHSAAVVWPGFEWPVDHRGPRLSAAANQRLGNDPRVLRGVRIDTYWGLIELANAASAVTVAELPPTLLQFGEHDRTVPVSRGCAFATSRGPGDVVRVYEGAGHRLWQAGVEAAAVRDLAHWLRPDPVEPPTARRDDLSARRACDAVGVPLS